MLQAVSVAGTLLKNQINSPARVAGLSEAALVQLGIDDATLRKLLLAIGKKGKKDPKTKKRGREADLDEPLPDSAASTSQISLDFREELEADVLELQSVVINRAPVMMAWATVVAERLSFNREEALSLAQAYTEANAISKGVSIGVYNSPKKSIGEENQSQPYVDLMGRQVSVISRSDEQWRGVVKGEMVEPSKAFGYLQRSFRQQLGSVIGAMRMLANSFPPKELNEKGYGLYIAFRPPGDAWGEKSQMKLSDLLALQRHLTHKPKEEPDAKPSVPAKQKTDQPSPSKKVKREEGADEFDDLLDDGLDASLLQHL